jgi:hypothetical protein
VHKTSQGRVPPVKMYWKCAKTGCVIPLSSLYCTVLICTPCWAGVRSGELTLLEFIAQTESKYLKQGASKDIGTVRNMMNWVVA